MTKLSDAQINMMVCKKLGLGLSSYARIITHDDATILLDDNKTLVDYCNNWADAGPIIESKLICLAADVFAEPHDGGKWVAQPAYGWEKERVRSDNPLRAAMIVFLEMQ